MEYTKDTKMSEIPDDLDTETASRLFASDFDEAAKALVHTLTHMGMTNEDYDSLLDSAHNIVSNATELLGMMNFHDADPTVEEYQPVTMLNDLTLMGLLAYTLYVNRDIANEATEKAVLTHYLEKLWQNSDSKEAGE